MVACQPLAHIPKKNADLDLWRSLFAGHPGVRFVLLGGPGQQAALEPLADGVRIHNLAGRTSVGEVARMIAGCHGFVGVDSGLAHIAAAQGVPLTVLSGNNNLGAFFPYPEAQRSGWQHVDLSPDHMDCAGCFSVCSRAPIWRNLKAGLPCIGNRDPERLSAAVQRMLMDHGEWPNQREATATIRAGSGLLQKGY